MKNKKPLVSVVMPVYNAGEFLREAIKSILSQTYRNFEFIIVEDASRDSSWKTIQEFSQKHKQIKTYRNYRNLGVSETVKKAISLAKGEFLCRMDADDVALPQRIEKQVNYLLNNSKAVAVGGQCLLIDKNGNILGEKTFPTSFSDIYKYIYKFIPVQQPTLIIAKNRLSKHFEYYRDGMDTAEEVELLFKLFQYGKVENLPDTVLMYRLHDKNTSLLNIRKTFLLTLLARIRGVFLYGYKPTLSGIAITLLQTCVALLLPGKLSLFLYKKLRKIGIPQRFSFSFAKNPFS